SGIIHVPGQSTVAETMAARSSLAADALGVQPAAQRADEPQAEDEVAVAEAPAAPRAKRPRSQGGGMTALMSRSDADDECTEYCRLSKRIAPGEVRDGGQATGNGHVQARIAGPGGEDVSDVPSGVIEEVTDRPDRPAQDRTATSVSASAFFDILDAS